MAEISSSFANSAVFSSLAFLILTWLMFHLAAKKLGNKRWKFSLLVLIVLLAWFSFVLIISKMRIFAINPLVAPFIFIGFIVLFGLLQKVYASKTIKDVAAAIPVPFIVGIQTYRIVGYGFLILYAQGILPAVFAFSAGYGDMIVGLSAPVVALLYYLKISFSRKLAIAWNIVGIADLIVAIGVGILGFPRPIQTLPLNPSTEPMSLFPLALISLFAVPLAFLLHFLSLRVLRERR